VSPTPNQKSATQVIHDENLPILNWVFGAICGATFAVRLPSERSNHCENQHKQPEEQNAKRPWFIP
ncbi:MAG: hypothetical protein WA826_06495, partial [Silvibacterium sp.]